MKNIFNFFGDKSKKPSDPDAQENIGKESLPLQGKEGVKDDAINPEVVAPIQKAANHMSEALKAEESAANELIQREKELLDSLGVDYPGGAPQSQANADMPAEEPFPSKASSPQDDIPASPSFYEGSQENAVPKVSDDFFVQGDHDIPKAPSFAKEKKPVASVAPSFYASPSAPRKASGMLVIVILVVVIGGLLTAVGALSKKSRDAMVMLNEANLLKLDLQKEIETIKLELKSAESEKESLDVKLAESMAQIQNAKESSKELENRQKELQGILAKEKQNVEATQLRYNKLAEEAKRLRTKQQELLDVAKKPYKEKVKAQTQAIANLRGEIKTLRETLVAQKARYYYNLGVAYTNAKAYPDAMDAYIKALEFDPRIAEAHYNLGLLYEEVEKDYARAALHYNNYLTVKPDAPDREQVKAILDKLREKGY